MADGAGVSTGGAGVSTGGVVSAAARLVKLQRTTFVEKMKRYQIGREIALSA